MFTQEQINEIEQRLALKGSKDTQLPEAELPLKGDETVAIIQEGENRNLPIEIFIKYPIEGAFNVSKYLQLINKEETLVKVSLEDAVTSVPTMAKNEGQTIVFIDSNNTWQCYQYQGDIIDDWDNLLKWKNLNDSSSAPIEEGAHIYNISEYLPGGSKYGQLIGAGVYTIYGDITPVSQYRTIFGWDSDLGEVNNPAEKDTSLVIKEIDTDGVAAYEYYVFVGNDNDGYGYQTTITSNEDNIPEWIDKAFGNTNDSILVNINKLKEEIDRTKISKGGLKTIQGKSIEGTGNIEIDTYINQFASSNNPINWNWQGDGNIVSVDIDNIKGVKASYSEEYTTGNVYSVLDVTLKAKQHYLFSFYLSGEGECDLSLSDLWNNVYVKEFSNPIIIDGNEYIENDDWKSHLTFTSVGYHYISFYANTSGTSQIDFEFNTNNNIIFYKPLFVACNAKATINWFANNEDIFTTKEQFGIAFKGVTYNSSTKKIEFTCVDNTKKYLDATDFVKDGMVSSVAIEDGNLVITFNTDSGKEAIIIPLTDIFNPANYYTKVQTDDFLGNKVDKEQGKGLSTNDYTNNDKNKLNALPTNNELTTMLNGKVDTADLNEYTKQVASEISHEQKYTGRHTITGTLHQVTYPTNNYRKTEMQPEWIRVVDARGENVKFIRMHFDDDYNPQIETLDDKVVWQNTATQQIPTATTEVNGLMSAEDKGKLNDLPTATELAQELGGKANSADLAKVATSGSYNDLSDKPTAVDVFFDNTHTGLSATTVQDAIDEMADSSLYETVVLTIGSVDSSFNPVGQTITVTLEDGSATQYEVLESRQITFIVQRGMRYNISGTSTDDYRVLPISVKAAIPIRYLTMRYIPIATGVFILQKDGNYYLREEYDAETMAKDAVGVLVLTSALINKKFGIVISKNSDLKNFPQSTHSGGRDYMEQLYNGYTTTQTMVAKGDSLASYCWGLSIQMDNGILQGFLPSQIEGKQVSTNMKKVNDYLKVIGGKILSSGDDYMTVNWYQNQCCGWVHMSSVNYRSNCCPVYYYPLL